MNLTMSECHSLGSLTVEVSQTHGDHSCLFFLDVDELNKTFLAARLEIPSGLLGSSFRHLLAACLVEHHLNVPLADLELVVLNDVERALHTTRICTELNLSLGEISHDRDLALNTTITSEGLEVAEKAIGIRCETDPITIDEDLGHLRITQIFSRKLLKLLDTPILQLVDDIG